MAGPLLSKAAILSTTLEGILYGFSVFMFGMTIWTLWTRRATRYVNRGMIISSAIFLLLSTIHMITDLVHIVRGLITYRNTYPGGPEAWFANLNEPTFILKNITYLITAVFADAVVVYRCYMVWQSWWFVFFPGLMVAGVAASGIGGVYWIFKSSPADPASYIPVQNWITAFYAATLGTNIICTGLLAYRIWAITNRVKKFRMGGRIPILMIVIDSGTMYAVVHLIILICWVVGNNTNYVFLDMAMPIIAISFYMVIIRIGMAKSSSAYADATMGGHTVNGSADGGRDFQMRPVEVHITQLTEGEIPHDDRDTKEEDLAYDAIEQGGTLHSESDVGGSKAL